MAAIDTSGTIEIRAAPGNFLLNVLEGVLLMLLCAGLALITHEGRALVGGFSIIWLVAAGLRAISPRGAVVTIAPEGIRDRRVADKFIPWCIVKGVSVWHARVKWGALHVLVTGSLTGQNIVVLAIDPADIRKLELPQLLAQGRGLNREVRLDGLCMTADGLETDSHTLRELCTAYANKQQDAMYAK